MREHLISLCPIMIPVITLLEAVITVLMFVKYAKKQQTITLLMAILGVGLFLDALVMSLGIFMPEKLLYFLNKLRFISHGLLVPINIAICGYGMNWFDIKLKIAWGLTAVLSLLGLASGIAMVLELKEFAGIVRYVAADSSPHWAATFNRILSFGTVIPIIAVGLYIWIKEKTPTFFLAGALMFVFAALGPATGNADLIFFISMFGELSMMTCFYLYAKQNAEI